MSKLLVSLVPPITTLYLRVLRATLSISEEGRENIDAEGSKLLAVWHNRLFAPIMQLGDLGIGVVVSQSEDGEMITRVIEKLGFIGIRGSSSRGGSNALRGILRHAKSGNNIAFTPDGPRGPRYKVKPGIAFAAQRTGLPFIPIGVSASRKKVFASWDRFQLPHPFSNVQFIYGEPLIFDKNDDIDDVIGRIEAALVEVNERADAMLGVTSP
ncbi:MAG: hypothetical protein C0608_04275 [Deltaproteobacteria bacterium]|nr:MAG: hypothetical protein C0608_04275 [Deltaproteobacteria bacterium]